MPRSSRPSRWASRLAVTAVGVVTAAAASVIGWRRFQARLTANSLVLNETLPIHSKWWRDHAKEKGDLLYVAIGDSAAQGIGASAPNRSYVGVLADEIRAVTGRTVRVVNLSVSGATVELAVRDQLPRFVKLRPDIVTVAIGANDIALWDPVLFERGIRQIFAALPPYALVADLPYFYFPRNERKVAVANRIVRSVAAEHGLTVVPLHAETKHQGIRGMMTQFAIDLFHPNDHGYRVWADAFAPSLAAQLVERFETPDVAPADVVGAA
ncbi:SGNH/GDSL hydrolase family protein [Agromyces sp. Marseille-P2726]|uniref:SGNH/GDSL hydrolase family protein n=1 Tax=Agromyces sp. Marseille-P2726 TaxID=2709132 RepID=UPI0020C1EA1D|nr:SGNH/GDSL hydrolase family protein [Agromyces sp. Marseille-P2726]